MSRVKDFLPQRSQRTERKAVRKCAAVSGQYRGYSSTKPATIPTKTAITRHNPDKNRHFPPRYAAVIRCPHLKPDGFYARKENFFTHKHFASMLSRFFIPRLRASKIAILVFACPYFLPLSLCRPDEPRLRSLISPFKIDDVSHNARGRAIGHCLIP